MRKISISLAILFLFLALLACGLPMTTKQIERQGLPDTTNMPPAPATITPKVIEVTQPPPPPPPTQGVALCPPPQGADYTCVKVQDRNQSDLDRLYITVNQLPAGLAMAVQINTPNGIEDVPIPSQGMSFERPGNCSYWGVPNWNCAVVSISGDITWYSCAP